MFLAALVLAADLRLELVRHSLTGAHYRYREYVEGLPTDNYVTSATPLATATAATRGGYATALLDIHGRIARREIREHVAYDYDVKTGALIRTIPLYFRGKPARVFDPNPVASGNDPSLQDGNDAASAVPDSAYFLVELEDVAPSGPLRGPNVALVDRQTPDTPPPDSSGSLDFRRDADGFEDVNAYFHIDRNQRYLQSLGYVGERSVAAYPIEVDAHAAGGSDNSLFLPSLTEVGRGSLAFGEGGTDDAEDADLVIHEYGHAILEWIAPGSFAGSFASQARALGEGFGDYWAFSQHVATRRASGRDPFCFADWDARCAQDDPSQQCSYAVGSDCLRRLDSTHTMADYDRTEQSGVEHRNGAIWSSALRDLHERIGKKIADTIILESVFDLPPFPTFAAAAHRIVESDQQLHGGAHVAAICEVMTARGIVADCAFTPRGELTHFQSNDRGFSIPDNDLAGITSSLTIADSRTVEELFVRVDISHTSRGDLRIELIAPDGTVVILKQVSIDGGRDMRTTFGLTAASFQPLAVFRGRSAAGVWQLRVKDLRPRDSGTLLSWDLVVRFADSAPLATRPRGEPTQMIPVVAHLFGVGATEFASDVRIANTSSTPRTATLIFTRSGDDGRTSFSAIDVALESGQTVALDDVVASAFVTAGSGSLEVIGDVIVMSRTYAKTDQGTWGQQVPANLDAAGLREEAFAIPLTSPEASRVNLGITEVGGGSGLVQVSFVNGTKPIAIAPFSHYQFPIANHPTTVEVLSGDARIVAYVSQVNGNTGDAMFIPASRLSRSDRDVIAPVISALGAGLTRWQSDVWMASQRLTSVLVQARFFDDFRGDVASASFTTPNVFHDVIPSLFARTDTRGALSIPLPGGVLAYSRVTSGGASQFVPFLTPDGPADQRLVFIESWDGYRTNIGIVANAPAVAEVVVYDSNGSEVERRVLSTAGGVAQMPVLARVVNGRALVRFTSGRGRAYASLIDNGTADATFVEGQ